ncbi:hypothetical protein J2Y74_001126 [Pseudomonas migulae]|nr:hypothetical protein [Pseudomonas migulae]
MPGCPLRRTSTRPLEGALRSKAEGELTLGLMSGENQKRMRFPVGAGLPAKNVGATRSFRHPALSLASIAGKPAPTISNRVNPIPVGAGLLAIAVDQSTHVLAGRTTSPASRLLQGAVYRFGMGERSKEGQRVPPKSQVGFQAASAAVAVVAPSRGRAQVLRSGQPGMDAGLAAPGHGWPMAAGPRSRTGARAWRALASHRTKGAKALGYLALLQVTRRKGETNRSRNPKNGYVLQAKKTTASPPTITVYPTNPEITPYPACAPTSCSLT